MTRRRRRRSHNDACMGFSEDDFAKQIAVNDPKLMGD
jgi:hypothetical protein